TTERANAVLVTLARPTDLASLLRTLTRFESAFNARKNYPYLIFANNPLPASFRRAVIDHLANLGASPVDFATIPADHWSTPSWIDAWRARVGRMGAFMRLNVPHGGNESYQRMCRWFSGFFFKHEKMLKYDWFWRIDSDVEYLCEIPSDPFLSMSASSQKYGFNIIAKEIMSTIPSLSATVIDFLRFKGISHIPPVLAAFWDEKSNVYDGGHFWSNFEIGDLRWFRSVEYGEFFDFLDRAGGFFYERWGDAPVHTLAAGVLLKPSELRYFGETGYRHENRLQCPIGAP
ncbi:nucleotide-diphospho-sugar transferase, partial [Blyttiomyces helicus]